MNAMLGVDLRPPGAMAEPPLTEGTAA